MIFISNTIYATKANPKILKWARETAGYTIQEIAKKLNVKEERIKNFENGKEHLTIRQLEKIALICKRPVAIFFKMETPQDLSPPDFRSKANVPIQRNEGKINIVIREIMDYKKKAESLYESMESNYDYSFLEEIDQFKDPKEVAKEIIRLFGINHDELKKLKDNDVLNKWKQWIESKNILVFQFQGLDPQFIRGFSFDEIPFPVIAINQRDSYYARCFTLIHELCHILIKKSGLCNFNPNNLGHEHSDIEKFCNLVAENVLFPDNALNELQIKSNFTEEEIKNTIGKISNTLKISHSIILHKLLHSNKISNSQFNSLFNHFKHPNQSKERSGGDYYTIFLSRISQKYIKETINAFEHNKISYYQLLDFIGMSSEKIKKLFDKLK